MPVLLFILVLVALAGGLIAFAMRLSARNVQVWRGWADSQRGAYTPKQSATSQMIDVVRDGVPVRILVYVGSAVVGGRRKLYNCLRASTEFHGPGLALLYLPSLHPEPVYSGEESEAIRRWLAAVDDLVRARPGLNVECDGQQLHVDLPRRTALDHVDDFELMTTLLSKLKRTAPATPAN